jgi:hypothetical protein
MKRCREICLPALTDRSSPHQRHIVHGRRDRAPLPDYDIATTGGARGYTVDYNQQHVML